jgi:riboflavin kinase/FMN adenylyltransferase
LKIYRKIEELVPISNAVATTGTFDGVHTGHNVIISRVKKISQEIKGESVIITFYPHPQLVLHPEEKNIFILNTEEEKIKLIEKYDIDHLIIIPFTKKFASISYTDFIKEILIDKLHVKKLVIGYDHHFGKDRKGTFRHLADYGSKFNFEVEEIEAQKIGETEVSSTKIRKALMAGDIRLANNYLGYEYFLSGKVVKGDNIGKTIGFPTANLEIADEYKLIPAQGAYAVEVEYLPAGESGKNKKLSGMMNIGMRPTVNGSKLAIEVNIFNFDENIYSGNLSVYFIERLRDEIKFPGLDQLKEQLLRDKEKAESILLKRNK